MKGRWAATALWLLIPALQAIHADGPSPAVDPAARLPEGDAAREYWDVVALLDSGHRFYARFLITNEGPGERSAVAMGDLVEPDGNAVPFQNGRRAGRWTLGAAGRSLRIGSSQLDLSGVAPRVEIDNDKRAFKVRLDFEPDESSARIFDANGYHMDLLNLASVISGSVQHAGMQQPLAVTGRATLSHSWTSRPEEKVLAARFDIASLSRGPAAFLTFWLSPAAPTRAWLGVREPDGSTRGYAADRTQLEFPRGERSDYPLPTRLDFAGDGVRAVGSLRGTSLARNPLDPLPMAIRMLYSFGAKPRRLWADTTLWVEVESGEGAESLPWEAPGIATLNFQSAVPVPDS